jgi:DNA invertase Pin-like site-specific DNA recombinase
MDAKTVPTKAIKAYSYVRFSTPEQMKGDSYERQTKKAGEYASAHGLDLDASLTFEDLGVSAYRSKNAATGALSKFLDAVHQGDIPQDSHLLVESLDRLSRDQIITAQGLFLQIVAAGIKIVTLIDNKVYSKESVNANPTDLIIAILSMIRAHEESAVKGARVAGAYERKRQQATIAAREGRPDLFTRMLPAWLDWDEKTGTHDVDQERAGIVREMFRRAAAGDGQHKIAQWLNAQKIPTWSRTKRKATYWHRSYVAKILANPAVMGTFVPHRKSVDEKGKRQRKPLDPIPNHYPAIVDADTFDIVASRFRPRGRHANQPTRSLFSGVMKCSHDGATVSRVSKGDYVYLVCSRANAKAATHPIQAVRYDDVEKAFRRAAKGIIADAPRTTDVDLEDQIRQCGVNIDAGEIIVEELVEELVGHKSDALRRKLQEAEAALEQERGKLRALIARRDTLGPERVERKLQALYKALTLKRFDVAEANAALRQAVRKIVMDVDTGTLAIHWHHAPDDPQEFHFPSRWVFANCEKH